MDVPEGTGNGAGQEARVVGRWGSRGWLEMLSSVEMRAWKELIFYPKKL